MNRTLILLLAFSILIGGCVILEKNTDAETATAENTRSTNEEITEQTEEGSDWCEKGTSWSWNEATKDSSAQWEIQGLTIYKGKTMCYVIYRAVNEGEEIIMEYYFMENNEDLYLVMKDSAGNIISEQHITD